MNKVVLFVNYLSVFEDGRYCRNPEKVSELISAHARQNAAVSHYCDRVKTRFNVDLCEEIRTQSLLRSPRWARAIQLYLYLCAGEIFSQLYDVEAVGGFSAGYIAACVLSGVYPIATAVDTIGPVLHTYITNNWSAYSNGDLASILLFDPNGEELNADAKARAGQPPYVGRLWIRDDRPPYAVWVGGERAAVEAFAEETFRRFKGARVCSTRLRKSDASHMGLYDYTSVQEMLRRGIEGTPRFRLVGGDGQVVDPGDPKSPRVGDAMFGAVFQALNMGRCSKLLRDMGTPLIAIGSEAATRFAFHGLRRSDRPERITMWENCIGTAAPEPLRFADVTAESSLKEW